MADIMAGSRDLDSDILLKYVDNGDGSYSPQVVSSAAEGGGGVSATLYAGTLTTSTTPAALAASQAVSEVVVQNDPDNTIDVLIGNASAQTVQLAPGDSITVPVDNLSKLYVVAASGAPVVNYLARS